MPNTLVTSDNLSKELLASIYDDAFMSTSYDDDGDLKVKEGISCFVLPSEKNDRIHFLSMFGFEPGSSEAQRLECVNNINSEYILVNAYVGTNNTLRFKYDLFIEGGMTKKNIVLATKRFLSIPQSAVQEHGIDIVE
ncbi:MAG: ornithine acetyltransferase [Desulfuromonadales bacterium C00003096]|nr:MAG: ornithine acetyltransferase [Desulfuromonadales bacterium C00003096]